MTRIKRRSPPRAAKSWGFTLIELMTVVVVIAILVAIAYPGYQDYIIRANRSSAQQFMLTIANREEQYLLDARAYHATIVGTPGLNLTLPSELATRYTFSVDITTCAPSPCYVITATPIGGQVRDLNDPLGSTNVVGPLTLDNLGQKAPAVKWKK